MRRRLEGTGIIVGVIFLMTPGGALAQGPSDEFPASGFSIQCEPASHMLRAGESASIACTIGARNQRADGGRRGEVTYYSVVDLDCWELPPGASCDYSVSSLAVPPAGSASTTLELSLAPSTAPGDYRFYVRGRSGALESSAAIDLQVVAGAVPCEGGQAGAYLCQDVDLVAHFPLPAIGGVAGQGRGGWGWSDTETGREYAIVGHSKGMAFLDVTDPDDVRYLGILPPHQGELRGREAKVFRNHLYVVISGALVGKGDGMQIFDLRGLRSVTNPPVTFAETAHYAGFTRAVNIAINEETGFAYAVGNDAYAVAPEACPGGLHMMSLQDPVRPAFVGCFGDQELGNTALDAQCVVYRGPDASYRGREICFVSNERFISIADVQDKGAPRLIARAQHADARSVRQGWLTEDHRYFLQADDLDELANGHNSRTYVWDMADLDAPKLVAHHDGPTQATDRRLYVKGNEAYQANFQAGFRMLSLSRVSEGQLDELGYFDMHPSSDSTDLVGAHSSYPFHKNGLVTVSDTDLGLFVLRPTGCRAPATPTLRLPQDGAASVSTQPVLDWDDVASASAYDVEVATDPSFEHVVRSQANLASSAWAVAPGLDASSVYWWRARAASSCATGAWSPGSSFTTGTPEPDFVIACKPEQRTAVRGGSGVTSICAVTSRNGFADPVTMSLLDLPAGDFRWLISPAVVTPPADGSLTSVLSMRAGPNAPSGTHTVRVQGSSGVLVRTFDVTLQVVDQPPQGWFSFECAPRSLILQRGGSGTAECTLRSMDGFAGRVEIGCFQPRPGDGCSLVPAEVELAPDGSVKSTLTITVPITAEPEDRFIFALARSGPLEVGTSIRLNVVPLGGACEDGKAGDYLCKDVDLLAQIPFSAIGDEAGGGGGGNWGWTDPVTGKEYSIVGHSFGTAFLDVTDPENVVYEGMLAHHQDDDVFGLEMKVYQDHLYVVRGGGLQIFDLTRLRSVAQLPPVPFLETAHYAGFQMALNIAINQETGFAYVAGTETCSSGLHIVSLQDPIRPVFAGCFADPGPSGNTALDAQCVVYRGPDPDYRGKEVCFVFNEGLVSIGDVQDKNAPRLVARTTNPDHVYVNSGGLSEDHRYLLQGGHHTRIYIWDVGDLDQPKLVGQYDAATQALNHQLIVKGNEVHQASFQAGYRMLSLAAVGNGALSELAYLDTRPESDDKTLAGANSVYPFPQSGLVTVSDSARGLFVLRPTGCRTPATPKVELPADGASGIPVSSLLDWSDVASATSYEIELAIDARFESVVRSASGALSSWSVAPALDNSTTYYWRARAANDCGSGAWSFGSSFTTIANRPPVLGPIGDKMVFEDGLLAFTVTASDPDGHALRYAATGLPPGATLDGATGAFAWRPTFDQAGSYPVTFEVSDGRGGTDSEAITIRVLNENRPPLANAGPDQTVPVSSGVTLDGSGSIDPDGDPLSYLWSQVSGLPVTIQGANTAKASVALVAPGSYVFELEVSDGHFSSSARDQVTVIVTGASAVYDPVLRAPKCSLLSDSCDSGELLTGRDGKGPEPNQPNTIQGTCGDGTSGIFHVDESVDHVRVSTLDGRGFAPGKTVKVEATVWAWARNPAADRLDLYYAADASKPAWARIATLAPTAGGSQTLSATYTLPAGQWQAVRARFRYNGSEASCQAGPFDDHDDLVFAVDETAAAFDPVLKAPRCAAVAGACDSGTLLVGRDGVGPEPNQPNTINGSCADGTSGAFHVDNSNDRIRVSTLDGSSFAPGKIVKVETTVWSSARSATRLDLYYASDANNPTWIPIKRLWSVFGNGAETLSTVYRLPEGSVQAIRARVYENTPGPCFTGAFDDHDDLVFAVGSASPPAVARFDPALKAPVCDNASRSCDSGTLLVGRDGKGPEPNQPNAINGSCADGTSGSFHLDESVDAIKVSTLDGGVFAPGKTVKVDATVWAWTNPAADHLELYYAADAADPSWIHIATLTPPAAGVQVLSANYTLPAGKRQAVRARFRYQGSPAPCQSGPYDDHDDLVFAVDHTTAVFDQDLKVPTCAGLGGACDSGTLLVGRDGTGQGAEPNQPNTLYGSCPDGSDGHRSMIDHIRVSTLDGGGFAPGKTVKLEVVVWPVLDLGQVKDTLELYGAPDALSPAWTLIRSTGPPNDGVPEAELLTATYVLPPGELQAVRARYRRSFGHPQFVPCTGQFTGHSNDHDDLVFAVRPQPPAEPMPGSFARPAEGPSE